MWRPQVGPQLHAIEATWCDIVFYGGARGGGKSDYLLGDFLQDVPTYGQFWRGIIFRKTYDELEELQTRAEELFPPTGAKYAAVKRTWYWPNGAYLKMRYMEREKDYNRYHGHQYTFVAFDELTSWPSPAPFQLLLSCLRQAGGDVPTKRIRASGNPGGVGHTWVKNMFIDPAPLGYKPIYDPETKMERMFIPAKVSDNKILLANDPNYIHRLKGTGTPELVRCWLDGDWNAVVGAYFVSFGPQHIVPGFKVPDSWPKFRSFDWGYSRPFSVGWWAISNGEAIPGYPHYFPRGALIRYREWYGASAPNVGLKLQNTDIAKGVVKRSGSEKYAYSVADPSIFSAEGGESIAETFAKHGVIFSRADNERIAGWQQLNTRLVGEDAKPMIYFMDHCVDAIRTLPAVQHDSGNIEDIDTEGEDHCPDEIRYAVMSRPWSPAPEPTLYNPPNSFNRLMSDKLRARGRKRGQGWKTAA